MSSTNARGRPPPLMRRILEDRIQDEVEVAVPPTAMWAWLEGLTEHYTEWHPDHVSAKWVRGAPNQIGSRFEAVEYFAGRRERLVFELTAVVPPHLMEYRILGPHSLLLPGGRFVVSERDQGSVFRAEIDVRFVKLAGLLFRRRLAALRTHMHEEGLAVRCLAEGSRAHT